MKQEDKLDLISDIDEKIVERNTRKRMAWWHRIESARRGGRGKNVAIILLAASLAGVLLAFGVFAALMLRDDPAPVGDGILSIEKTAESGDTATYTITYKDGTSASLTVTDRAPAGSGASITGVSFDDKGSVYLGMASGKLLNMGTAVGYTSAISTVSAGGGSYALTVTPPLLLLGATNGDTDIAGVTVDEEEVLSYELNNGKHLALGHVHKKTEGEDSSLNMARINESGELILGFASGETVNLGRVVGKDGKDGVGIEGIVLSPEGELSVTLTNGTVLNLGNIKGQDGIGIAESKINDAGELVLTYTDGNSVNLGRVVGERGEDGVGIGSININDAGELTISLTDGTNLNLGVIKGQDGKSAYELYKDKFGYEGTEEEWLFDLVNGNLATKIKYPVTFDSAGGSEVPVQEIEEGGKVIEPEPPTRAGYTFLGWYYGEELWSFAGYSVTEAITLTAKWDPVVYSITYSVGELGEAFMNSQENMVVSYTVEDEVTIQSYETSLFLGWTFEGQTTPKRSITLPKGTTGDLEFTAHFSLIDQFPVRVGTVGKIHDNVDAGYITIITPEVGTEVYAMTDATVICVQQDNYTRLLLHIGDGLLIFYPILSPELPDTIYAGAKVSKGDLIGWSVTTDTSFGDARDDHPWIQLCAAVCPEKITDEMIEAYQGFNSIWEFPGVSDHTCRINPLTLMSEEVLAALGYTPEEK